MKTLRFAVRPLAPFGTPIAGDTLFGHLCWAIRETRGDRGLSELLDGYVTGRPFVVISDGFPGGLLPRPTAPDFVLGLDIQPGQRKLARTHRWLPAESAGEVLPCWMKRVVASKAAELSVLTQNTINRHTATTGADQFAPRQIDRIFFTEGARLDIYAVLDEVRLTPPELQDLLTTVGVYGYGRDATTGLGKFSVESVTEQAWPEHSERHRHWLTLAPCAPDTAALLADECYFLPLTRFGRHGNLAATMAAPFKQPVMMMAAGALLTAREPASWTFHGRGLGGVAAPLSKEIPETVHQGYTPVVPLRLESGR